MRLYPALTPTGDADRWPDVKMLRLDTVSSLLRAVGISDDDLVSAVMNARLTLTAPWSITPAFADVEDETAFANIWNAALDEQRRRRAAAK